MRRFLLSTIIILTFHVSSGLGQTIDSSKYWHDAFDSAATRYVQAKIALFNIQDCINKISARPKSFVYVTSWINRMQDDLNHFYTVNKVKRPVLVHRKKKATK